MALSSDEIIKREIIDKLGYTRNGLKIRIFPQSSNEDQKLFSEGGLTFSADGVDYGSCDAAWYREINGRCIPVIGLEGTDALNRKSSGNAQYQRFHHALGAVKNGIIGVYYLKRGIDKIQEDLFEMAYSASKHEKGTYLIIDDLEQLKPVIDNINNQEALQKALDDILENMHEIFMRKFRTIYHGSWQIYAEKRSTIIEPERVIKYAGRMRRNFTDSSQRAGHIAVGEMYLTKYHFYGKQIIYLMPKMTRSDVDFLDIHKSQDKEWYLLRNEPMVEIKTMDDLVGLPTQTKQYLLAIQDEPLKGNALKIYNRCVDEIVTGIKRKSITIK